MLHIYISFHQMVVRSAPWRECHCMHCSALLFSSLLFSSLLLALACLSHDLLLEVLHLFLQLEHLLLKSGHALLHALSPITSASGSGSGSGSSLTAATYVSRVVYSVSATRGFFTTRNLKLSMSAALSCTRRPCIPSMNCTAGQWKSHSPRAFDH